MAKNVKIAEVKSRISSFLKNQFFRRVWSACSVARALKGSRQLKGNILPMEVSCLQPWRQALQGHHTLQFGDNSSDPGSSLMSLSAPSWKRQCRVCM